MNDFTQILALENAQVIWQKKELSRANENANFFYAFCQLGQYFYSLHQSRKQPAYTTPPTHIPLSNDVTYLLNGQNIERYITLSKYQMHDGRLEVLESHIVSSVIQGTDPRIVSDGKDAWAIMYSEDADSVDGMSSILLNIRTLSVQKIKFKSSNIKYGKNWQPFIDHGQLFAVHELSPFRIIKIDVATGMAEMIYESDNYLPVFSTYDSYPLVRGGSNTIIWNDSFIGLGHATSEVFRHHPFIWTHTKKTGTTILFIDLFYHFTKHGYSLIDPTSLFVDEEFVYVGLDCHERDRQHEQKMLHILLRFNKNSSGNGHKMNQSLLEFLKSEPVTEHKGIPNLSCHRFFCAELPSSVLYEQRRGVRTSIGLPGHIMHGPYLSIVNEGSFSAELSYFTKNDRELYCGVFEVVALRKNPDGSIDIHSPVYLAQSELEATAGVLMKKKLVFSTNGQLNNFLEFRVFSKENAIVSICDIVTKGMGENA